MILIFNGELCSTKYNCIRLQMLVWTSCPRSQLLAVFTACVICSHTFFLFCLNDCTVVAAYYIIIKWLLLFCVCYLKKSVQLSFDTTTMALQVGFQSVSQVYRFIEWEWGRKGDQLYSYSILSRRLNGRYSSRHWALTFNLPHCGKNQLSLVSEVSGKRDSFPKTPTILCMEGKKKKNQDSKTGCSWALFTGNFWCLFIRLSSRTCLDARLNSFVLTPMKYYLGCEMPKLFVHHIVSSVLWEISPLHLEFLKPLKPLGPFKFSCNLYYLWEFLVTWN